MYSEIKNVQILVALLKEYDLQNIVMAPGGSNIPIIHSIETDPYFKCYSVVDERSMVYFAMGIAQEKQKPVVCICTSGTAVCNFLPGMTEAYYQDVPIVAITADKNPYRLNQLETQKIEQNYLFSNICKKSVNLPIVKSKEEEWYCGRLINEALLEISHHGTGPVHINIPVIGRLYLYDAEQLPKVKKISRISKEDDELTWKNKVEVLEKANRILVVVGQNIIFTDKEIKFIEQFFEKFNCVISVEHLSNLKCKGTIRTYSITEACDKELFEHLCPDVVISLGNNIASAALKPEIRSFSDSCEHWQIDPAGRVRDMFDCLTTVFECSSYDFFEKFINFCSTKSNNDYYKLWKSTVNLIEIPEVEFSDFYAVQKISEVIPNKSIVHAAILNSTRLFQYFDLQKDVKFYSNVGGLGIDGCLSSFMGQALSTNELAFCVLGDLSYFYDMNACGIRNITKNIRIILLNNGGGGEFHYLVGKDNISTINNYISAEHKKNARGWIESLGYRYYAVRSKSELQDIVPIIVKNSDKPIFVEVLTDMEKDADIIKTYYKNIRAILGGKKAIMKDVVRNVLGKEGTHKLKKLLGK